MNTYHIFEIKKEIYNIYIHNKFELFKLLYNLYNLNKKDLNYGITLYNQICNPINTKKIKKYLELLNNIRKGNNKYLIKYKQEKSLILIKPSHIIYKAKELLEYDLYILNNYNKYLFICNFEKKEYLFIQEELNKNNYNY